MSLQIAKNINRVVIKEELEDDSFSSSSNHVKTKDSTIDHTHDNSNILYVDIPITNNNASMIGKFPPGCRVLHLKSVETNTTTDDNDDASDTNDNKNCMLAEFVKIEQLAIYLPTRETTYKFTSQLSPQNNYHFEADLSFAPQTRVWFATDDGRYRKAVIVSSPQNNNNNQYSLICLETNILCHNIPDECICYRRKDDQSPPTNSFTKTKCDTEETISYGPPCSQTKTRSLMNTSKIITPSPPPKKRRMESNNIDDFPTTRNINNNISRRVSNIIIPSSNHDDVPQQGACPIGNKNSADKGIDLFRYQRLEDRQEHQAESVLTNDIAGTNVAIPRKQNSSDDQSSGRVDNLDDHHIHQHQEADRHAQMTRRVYPIENAGHHRVLEEEDTANLRIHQNQQHDYENNNSSSRNGEQLVPRVDKFSGPYRQIHQSKNYNDTVIDLHSTNSGYVIVPEWVDIQCLRERVIQERNKMRKFYDYCAVNLSKSLMQFHPEKRGGEELQIQVTTFNSETTQAILQTLQRFVAESVITHDQSLVMYDLAFLNLHHGLSHVQGEFAYNFVPPSFTEKKWIGIVPLPPHLHRKTRSLFLDNDARLVRSISKECQSVVLVLDKSKVKPHILICSRTIETAARAKERVMNELDRLLC